jgi:hypothetical protein
MPSYLFLPATLLPKLPIGLSLIDALLRSNHATIFPIHSKNAWNNRPAKRQLHVTVHKMYSIRSMGNTTASLYFHCLSLNFPCSCKNELTQCTAASSLFDARNLTATWHLACDNKVSFAVTTPVLLQSTTGVTFTSTAIVSSSISRLQSSTPVPTSTTISTSRTVLSSGTTSQIPPSLRTSASVSLSTSSPSTGAAITMHDVKFMLMNIFGGIFFHQLWRWNLFVLLVYDLTGKLCMQHWTTWSARVWSFKSNNRNGELYKVSVVCT